MAASKEGKPKKCDTSSLAVFQHGKIIVAGMLALLTLTLPGCKSSREIALNDRITVVNLITELLNSIADGESAKEAKPKLKKMMVRLRELNYQLERLGKARPGDGEEATVQYRQEFSDAVARCRKAMAKAMSKPENARIIGQIIEEEYPGFPAQR